MSLLTQISATTLNILKALTICLDKAEIASNYQAHSLEVAYRAHLPFQMRASNQFIVVWDGSIAQGQATSIGPAPEQSHASSQRLQRIEIFHLRRRLRVSPSACINLVAKL